MADGRQHIVGFLAPTAPLEVASALDGRPHLATATAMDNVTAVLVPKALLPWIAEQFPVTVRNAIELLCLEVRQREIATVIASVKDARGRIGCTLLQLARQFGVPNGRGTRIAYRLSRQDIADRSGVTIETAIRVLSDLQRRGVIHTSAQVIEIVDLEGLRGPTECDECQFDCSVFGAAGRSRT
jgi:CRP/FNR family transcriptional regulator